MEFLNIKELDAQLYIYLNQYNSNKIFPILVYERNTNNNCINKFIGLNNQ